ncbi:MAG: carbohydrate kinase family protein [Blautia sp.]|nr:carbohydrate kinase family protein [Blautia sp.]
MELDNWNIEPVEYHTGGDALTVAVVLAKMGEDVTLSSEVGNDSAGQFIKKELDRCGVKTDLIRTVKEYSTATSYQLIEEDGQRHFLVDKRIHLLPKSSDVRDEDLKGRDLLFYGSALAINSMDDVQISDLFRRAHAQNVPTAMDASVAVPDSAECKMDLLRETLKETDIFIPSYEEASYLAQKTDVYEIIDAFRQFPFRVFGIKLGSEGCIVTEDFNDFIKVPPCHVEKVVDTTGAGDCFMGGFLCAYLKGWTLRECAVFGSAVAAFGISDIGATTAVPDFDTVYSFMKRSL